SAGQCTGSDSAWLYVPAGARRSAGLWSGGQVVPSRGRTGRAARTAFARPPVRQGIWGPDRFHRGLQVAEPGGRGRPAARSRLLPAHSRCGGIQAALRADGRRPVALALLVAVAGTLSTGNRRRPDRSVSGRKVRATRASPAPASRARSPARRTGRTAVSRPGA